MNTRVGSYPEIIDKPILLEISHEKLSEYSDELVLSEVSQMVCRNSLKIYRREHVVGKSSGKFNQIIGNFS